MDREIASLRYVGASRRPFATAELHGDSSASRSLISEKWTQTEYRKTALREAIRHVQVILK